MKTKNSFLITPESIIAFWFGPDHGTFQANKYSARWFSGDTVFDNEIRARFQKTVEQALTGQLNWKKMPESFLAMILLLDQFPRNIYRKQAKAFAGDSQALSLTKNGINTGMDLKLESVERLFFYMPLMHSETLEDQLLCITQLKKLTDDFSESVPEMLQSSLHFARQHYNIIKTYGRFPYRNAVLARKNTPEEVEFLKQGIHFGQG